MGKRDLSPRAMDLSPGAIELSPQAIAAIDLLKKKLAITNFNFYRSRNLIRDSGCTPDDLNALFKSGQIKAREGINDVLVVLVVEEWE